MSIQKCKALIQKAKQKLLHIKQSGKIDKGAIFVVVFLITLISGSYMLVGGTLPTKLPGKPNFKNLVVIKAPSPVPSNNSLQLLWLQGVTLTPLPESTSSAEITNSEINVTEVDCKNNIPSDEPGIIWAYRTGKTKASTNQESVQIFYMDDRALPLGTSAMSKPNVDHITNPSLGVRKDQYKSPISPSLFITDITANPNDTSGDVQTGGLAQAPTDVYGSWKTETGTDPQTKNYPDIGQNSLGADEFPGSNIPSDNRDSDYASEIVWKLANLKTNKGEALTGGKTYRVQAIVHSGADKPTISQVCFTMQMPNAATAGPQAPAGYTKLTCEDDFLGTALDTNKWKTTKPGTTGYQPSDVAVNASVAEFTFRSAAPQITGLINSNPWCSFKYGLIEAKLWFPKVSSSKYSFGLDNPASSGAVGAISYSFDEFGYSTYSANNSCTIGSELTGISANAWHTFTIEWDAASVKFSVDGIAKKTSNCPPAIPLTLNLTSEVEVNAYPKPDKFKVDWVRVWQK